MIRPGSSSSIVFVIGGGIGSGKSTVGRVLGGYGAFVIEADLLGHEVLEPDGAAFPAVAARWPMVVVDGSIDRAALAAIVFTDHEQLVELEEFTHPAIAGRIRELAAGAAGPVVLEVPVVVDLYDGEAVRVFVDAPDELRVERAVRRGEDEGDVRRRMRAQAERSVWRDWADRVIDNSGSMEGLRSQLAALWGEFVP